jgi:hypothetical protein
MPGRCHRGGRWTRIIAVFAAALVEATGGIVAAQDVDPRSTARLRLGPVYVTPTLELRDIGVDTNVYNESSDDPIKDFVLTAVPVFVATVGPPRAGLSIRSATSFVYFAQQASERSVNQDLTFTARGTFGRITPFAEFYYLNTRERVTFEVDARARRVEQRATGGVVFALTPKVSVDAHGEYWQNAFDSDFVYDTFGLAAELNRKSQMVGGSLGYKLTPLTSISVLGEAAEIRFKEATFRDTDTRLMSVAVDLNPRALIAGSARVGYQRFRPLNANVPAFDGLVGSAAVSYRLRSRTSLRFTFDRHTEFSYYVVEPYYVLDSYGVAVRRQVVPQWDVELNVSRGSHRYLRLLQVETDKEEGHREILLIGGVTLGYDIGPRTRMTVGVVYQDRRSDFSDDRRYDGFRIGLSMIYGF